jgi:hypothetical protein
MKSPEVNYGIDKAIRQAIEAIRIVKLRYLGKERIVEPHDYGIHRGTIKLLTYQIGGASSGRLPNWRLMEVDKISDIVLLDKTFCGGRPTPSGKHHQWDVLFLRVKSAT